MQYYEAFPELAGVSLEDSWVLELAPSVGGLALRLDAVLTPEHPLYRAPTSGEQHCYLAAWLTVLADPMEVHLSGRSPAQDASRESDFGHVDAFVLNPTNDLWELEGDWGHARAGSPEVTLRFT